MTQDKARKRAARERATRTGESYTRAARLIGAGQPERTLDEVAAQAMCRRCHDDGIELWGVLAGVDSDGTVWECPNCEAKWKVYHRGT